MQAHVRHTGRCCPLCWKSSSPFQFSLKRVLFWSVVNNMLYNGFRASTTRISSAVAKCDMHFFLQQLKPVFGSNRNTPLLPPCFACELGGLVVVVGGRQSTPTRVMCVTRRVFAGRPLYDLGGRTCNMDNTKMSFDKVRNSRVAISLPKAAFWLVLKICSYKNLDDDHMMDMRYTYIHNHKNRTPFKIHVFGMKTRWWDTYSFCRFLNAINLRKTFGKK